MGVLVFLMAVLLGTALAWGIGREPVKGGLYCGVAFAASMILVQMITQNPQTAFILAGPAALAACFLAPRAEEKG